MWSCNDQRLQVTARISSIQQTMLIVTDRNFRSADSHASPREHNRQRDR